MRFLGALVLLSIFTAAAEDATPRVFKERIAPHWRSDSETFWYENELRDGVKEIIVVDALKGLRERVEKPPENFVEGKQPAEGPRRRRNQTGGAEKSPDEKWIALIRDHNLFVKSTADDKEWQLTADGREGMSYGSWSWSPDSKRLTAFCVEPGEKKEVHLVQSSPPGGGRAILKSRPYALPGDKFASYRVCLFDVQSRGRLIPEVDRFEHEWETPRVHWRRDGTAFSYQQVDRGHQRLRVIEVNALDGSVRNLVDERSMTFIWTVHTENMNLDLVNWLESTDEIVYVSEQSGWRQLCLVDVAAGSMKAITDGQWVLRGIEKIDEDARQIWFRASGVFSGQDPYLTHFGRVNFDGTGLVWLTEADGNHSIQFSPDRRFLIDSYSRVDAPPVHELRSAVDGKLICKLETAEVAGWHFPEVFVAKGRDGKTDIWGVICRPRDLDPTRKYPILEDIYAGPQGSFVPKSFSLQARYASWNKLGFIVVKIDGMGTANRSKAFHDVCYKNLKDAGFEDRILWIKAAAQKYPYMDMARVGIYGTSAGGQNAGGAVLFHPEFYKAAIANCGCHDNRMDKASWNEQWMGYPVGPQYSECSNIDNAGKLGGALFLIVGEMDSNVPPESTTRFADALIKANKDFEYLVVPGADHGTRGPASSYVQRRMENFFVKHLQPEGVSPSVRNGTNPPPSP